MIRGRDLVEQRELVGRRLPRMRPRCHLDHRHAHRPAVCCSPVPLLLDHLGGHPVGGASHRARVRVLRHGPPQLCGCAEVSDLDDAVGGDKQIRSLDIAVHHGMGVDEGETLRHLPRVLSDHGLGEPSEGLAEGSDGASGAELHEDAKAGVHLMCPDVLNDVSVLEGAEQEYFVLDLLLLLLRDALQVYTLHRHELSRQQVHRLVHLPERSLPH
mmetsp:Transcript_19726/g.45074  ORF Transcript_19726/g.45074 Transcript_19726/m.45074 type:complete len:214 (-) Transcript_19726:747-1388(-)